MFRKNKAIGLIFIAILVFFLIIIYAKPKIRNREVAPKISVLNSGGSARTKYTETEALRFGIDCFGRMEEECKIFTIRVVNNEKLASLFQDAKSNSVPILIWLNIFKADTDFGIIFVDPQASDEKIIAYLSKNIHSMQKNIQSIRKELNRKPNPQEKNKKTIPDELFLVPPFLF